MRCDGHRLPPGPGLRMCPDERRFGRHPERTIRANQENGKILFLFTYKYAVSGGTFGMGCLQGVQCGGRDSLVENSGTENRLTSPSLCAIASHCLHRFLEEENFRFFFGFSLYRTVIDFSRLVNCKTNETLVKVTEFNQS